MLQRMLVYVFSDGLSKAMPFLVLPVIANYLTTEDFGIVTNYNVLLQVLTALIALSTPSALSVYYFRNREEDRKSLLSNLLYLNLMLFALSLILVAVFGRLIEKALAIEVQWQLYAVFVVLFNTINNIQLTKLRLEERAKAFGVQQFIRSAMSAGLSLIFVIGFKWTWEGRLSALILTGIGIGTYSLIMLFREQYIFSPFRKKQIKEYANFGYPLLPKYLSGWLKSGFEKIFITTQISLAANGLFSFAGTIASIFYIFTTSFFSAYTPHLFKTLAENENNKNDQYKIRLVQTSYLFALGYGGLLFFGYFAIRILLNNFFNPEYREALQFIPFLFLSQFFHAFYLLFGSYLTYFRKTKIIGSLTVVTSMVNVLVTYLLLSRFGTMGAAYTSAIMSLITIFPIFYFSNKTFPMPWLALNRILQIKKS